MTSRWLSAVSLTLRQPSPTQHGIAHPSMSLPDYPHPQALYTPPTASPL